MVADVITEIVDGVTYTQSGTIVPNNTVTRGVKITLTGTTYTREISLNFKCRIDKVSMYHNTTSPFTYSIRMFGNPADTDMYEELDSASAVTAQSIIWTSKNPETYKYNRPVKLQFNFSSYTISDTVSLFVQLTRL